MGFGKAQDEYMSAPAISTVGVPKEVKTAEHRVAITPDGVRELERHGVNVFVETGAGGLYVAADPEQPTVQQSAKICVPR